MAVSRAQNGPSIPVRLNRCIVLRQLLAARRGDASMTVQPLKAESGAHVTGLNKAATTHFNKHIQSWFREQTMVVDRMNRHQNSAYDNLVRLQRRKELLCLKLERARELKRLQAGAHSARGERVGHVPQQQQAAAGVTEVKSQAQAMTGAQGDAERATSPQGACGSRGVVDGAEGTALGTSRRSTRSGKVFTPTQSKGGQITVSPHDEVTDLCRQVPDSDEEGPVSLKRSKSFSPAITSNRPELQSSFPKIAPCNKPPALAPKSPLTLPALQRSKTLPAMPCSRKWVAVPCDEVTRYKKDKDGRIVTDDLPYTRRKFRSPKTRDPRLLEAMLIAEQRLQSTQKEKFDILTKELENLEGWNPLQEISKYLQAEDQEEARSEGQDRGQGQVSLSMHRLMQAYGHTQQYLLRGLDPSSPEALKMCRYIRSSDNLDDSSQATLPPPHGSVSGP